MPRMLFAGGVMEVIQMTNCAIVAQGLREDLIYAHLNNGSRIRDVADLRQYIYEQIGRIRTNAFMSEGLYGAGNGHGQDPSQNNGHNGRSEERIWRERPAGRI